MTYRADIDGLRALAVLAVIIYHYFPSYASGGFVGVDVFFVISGYLITMILLNDISRNEFSLYKFYERRVKRIFPALLLVFGTILTIGWFGLLSDELKFLGKHVTSGSLFLSNIAYWGESGYFDTEAAKKPLLHLWSLGVEEQFYLIWPFVIFLIVKYFNNRLLWLLAMILCSFVYSVYTVATDPTEGYYSPLSRFWELAAGSALAYVVQEKPKIIPSVLTQPRKTDILVVFGIFLILMPMFFLTKKVPFPGLAALPSVVGTLLLIWIGNKSKISQFIFGNSLAVWFGKISYPLYLWHWPILSFGSIYYLQMPSRSFRFFALFLSIILAWFTYHFLEKKVRYSKSKKTLVLLLFLNFSFGTVGYVFYKYDGVPSRSSLDNIDFSIDARNQFMGSIWKYTNNQQCLIDFEFPGYKDLKWWFCMKSSDQPTTIAIIGNSYANQLYPGFITNEQLKHHTILSIGTCGFAAKSNNTDPSSPCYRELFSKQEKYIDELLKSELSIRFVVIGGVKENPDEQYIERFIKKVRQLEKLGKQVIIFKPHLKPEFHPKACFSTPMRKTARDCSFDKSLRIELDTKVNPLIQELEALGVGLVFDQNDVFCDNGICSWTRNKMPLHRDEAHTSEYASQLLHKYFTPWADKEVSSIFSTIPSK